MTDQPEGQLDPDKEREEKTCTYCGLVYQQATEGYEDGTLHAMCPRCNQINQSTT